MRMLPDIGVSQAGKQAYQRRTAETRAPQLCWLHTSRVKYPKVYTLRGKIAGDTECQKKSSLAAALD
jgi:hypothetical protein